MYAILAGDRLDHDRRPSRSPAAIKPTRREEIAGADQHSRKSLQTTYLDTTFHGKYAQLLHKRKKHIIFAPQKKKRQNFFICKKEEGPFVYRLGRKIFILERGVRFSYGLQRDNSHAALTRGGCFFQKKECDKFVYMKYWTYLCTRYRIKAHSSIG